MRQKWASDCFRDSQRPCARLARRRTQRARPVAWSRSFISPCPSFLFKNTPFLVRFTRHDQTARRRSPQRGPPHHAPPCQTLEAQRPDGALNSSPGAFCRQLGVPSRRCYAPHHQSHRRRRHPGPSHDRKLPVPASTADLKSLSAKELEVRAIHAARFHQNWSSSNPRPKRSIEFLTRKDMSSVDDDVLQETHPHPVSRIYFPAGYNGELVITVERMRVVCWEVPLGGSEAFMLAERTIPQDAIIDGLVVNEDPDNEAILVLIYNQKFVSDGHPTSFVSIIEAWSLDRFHGHFNIMRRDTVSSGPGPRTIPVCRLTGDWALFGDPVSLWNWRQKGKFLQLNYNTHQGSVVPNIILAVKLIRNHLLVVRQSFIQLLPVPQFDEEGRPIRGANAVGAYLHLHDLATEAVIVVHEHSPEEKQAWLFEPATVILRVTTHDDRHTVRKYDILPLPSTSDPNKLPCHFPHHPTLTVPVVPSCGHLVVGKNGKGMWMETRNVTAGRSTFTARCFVGFDATSRVVYTGPKREPAWRNEFELRSKEMFVSRVGVGEVEQRKYRILATSLEDTVGRIAIGGRDGKVEILDFV
ncbi:hypothetical protein BV25DRAFT_379153 [Artomyces pyxidatus]|uniref:Uncharacterized protein n=1 Tax=Artomyces pyxidatus TaxID=48021 RepID=A0ACB8T4S2_9AGAM|nr:hypothetical protein BV25DRAFT_379153 [Artomyces pyxidatus]